MFVEKVKTVAKGLRGKIIQLLKDKPSGFIQRVDEEKDVAWRTRPKTRKLATSLQVLNPIDFLWHLQEIQLSEEITRRSRYIYTYIYTSQLQY